MQITYNDVILTDFDCKKHSSMYVKIHNDGEGFDFQRTKKKITVSSFDENISNVYTIIVKDAAKHTKCIGFLKIADKDEIGRTILVDFATDEDSKVFSMYGKSILCATIELFIGRLNYNKLIIQEDLDNLEKINIIKNSGFIPEVRRRKHKFRNGKYCTMTDYVFFAKEDT